MSTPEPPPVQRSQTPAVQSIPGPPPVQRSQPTTPPSSAPSKWNWWPDHPGKRVMLLATICWLALLIPVYVWGLSMPYRYANRPSPDSFYIVKGNESALYSEREMSAISSEAGAVYIQRLTLCYAFAVAIGGVMVLAIERKPDHH